MMQRSDVQDWRVKGLFTRHGDHAASGSARGGERLPMHRTSVTGGTGYIGRILIERLTARGHSVRALVRAGSEGRLPSGAVPVVGDALSAPSYAAHVAPADTLVQLVGTPHPSPRKAAEFERVDRPSGLAAVEAALAAGVKHSVYVSVAHPAPIMHEYIAARVAVEARIHEAHAAAELNATILRPWYVLGPGHRWAHACRRSMRSAAWCRRCVRAPSGWAS